MVAPTRLSVALLTTLASICLGACKSPEVKPVKEASEHSQFKANVSQALELELSGPAEFWCASRPVKTCGLHLRPSGLDADSINFTIVNSTRPKVGTYNINPDIDPTGTAMRGNYLSGKKGGSQNFVGTMGEVVITESSARNLKGRFSMEALGVDPVDGVNPPIKITGEFVAECHLMPRAAYTCD